jgi:hypothetical protein
LIPYRRRARCRTGTRRCGRLPSRARGLPPEPDGTPHEVKMVLTALQRCPGGRTAPCPGGTDERRCVREVVVRRAEVRCGCTRGSLFVRARQVTGRADHADQAHTSTPTREAVPPVTTGARATSRRPRRVDAATATNGGSPELCGREAWLALPQTMPRQSAAEKGPARPPARTAPGRRDEVRRAVRGGRSGPGQLCQRRPRPPRRQVGRNASCAPSRERAGGPCLAASRLASVPAGPLVLVDTQTARFLPL